MRMVTAAMKYVIETEEVETGRVNSETSTADRKNNVPTT